MRVNVLGTIGYMIRDVICVIEIEIESPKMEVIVIVINYIL